MIRTKFSHLNLFYLYLFSLRFFSSVFVLLFASARQKKKDRNRTTLTFTYPVKTPFFIQITSSRSIEKQIQQLSRVLIYIQYIYDLLFAVHFHSFVCMLLSLYFLDPSRLLVLLLMPVCAALLHHILSHITSPSWSLCLL